MSESLPNMSPSQLKAFSHCLYRRGIPVPEDEDEARLWLSRQGMFQTIETRINYLFDEDPTNNEYEDDRHRSYALCFLYGLDCFSQARSYGLEKFLESLEQYPNLLSDERRLIITLREMNRAHQYGVKETWKRVQRAILRYNENIDLGRPPLSSLDILYHELKEARAFSATSQSSPALMNLKLFSERVGPMLLKARKGKSLTIAQVRDLVSELNTLVHTAFNEEAAYWFNTKMVKHFVRDTLIPHATINQYLDPIVTTDYMGAVWRFVVDAKDDSELLICAPLLFHQKQQEGSRLGTAADFIEELGASKVKPERFPFFRNRIEERIRIKQEEGTWEEKLYISKIMVHPYLRLARDIEFIDFIVRNYYTRLGLTSTSFHKWLSNSLFKIDPRNGIPSQALATALTAILSGLKDHMFTIDDPQAATAAQELYNNTIESLIENMKEKLMFPFTNESTLETGKIDSFEVKEALTDLLMAGLYQPDSDWNLEKKITSQIDTAIVRVKETEAIDAFDNFLPVKEAHVALEHSLDDLKKEALEIRIDSIGLQLWYFLCCSIPAQINVYSTKRLLSSKLDPDFLLPINTEALRRQIEKDRENDLLDILRQIDT